MKTRIWLGFILLVAAYVLMPGVGRAQEMPGLPVGAEAPDFTAPTYEGKTITLSDYYQDGPVVLIFYRGAWCPYCNRHLKSFQDRIEDFNALGASLVAVSVDKPEYRDKTVRNNSLDFDVVSDPGADILKDYRLMFKVPDALNEKYLNEYGLDLELHSGRKDHVIAIPATYVIDASGKIVFAYADEDYKLRTEPEEVLSVLEELE